MSREISVKSFKFAEDGLTQIFGELEAKLVEAVWNLKHANVQDIINYLGGDLNYKTTMTVLNRLTEKGILKRRKEGRAFVYTAATSKQDLLASVFDQMVRGMFNDDFRHIALAQLIETVEAIDPQLLENISQLIKQRKQHA